MNQYVVFIVVFMLSMYSINLVRPAHLVLIVFCLIVCLSPCAFPQAKVENEVLEYKDLAALPKVKAIYDLQRPNLLTCEPYHAYYSDDRLERLSYGEVLP